MNWQDLNLSEKSELMKLYLQNGITSLSAMKEHYNSFATGGHLYQEGGPNNLKKKPKFKQSEEQYYDRNNDIIYAQDSIGEGYQHEYFHARPNTALLNNLRPYYENLNDNRLIELGADLPFVKRVENDPNYFYSPEEIGARVSAARYMLEKAGVKNIDAEFLKNARLNELKYGDNFRDLLHMYNDENLLNIFNGQYQKGGSLGHITNLGQWQYPGEVTTIPSNNITMKGVNYPVLGVSNTGDTKYMLPNMDYLFEGQYVTEYPVHKFQRGGQHIPYEAKAKLSEDIMTQIWMPGYKRKYRDDVLLQAGPMQASFLLSGSDKDRYMLEHGYIKGQEGDYGLVKKAIGDNSYPVYQTAKDDEYRENLIPIANIMASDSHNWWGQETVKLRHAGSYPTTLYIDGRNPEKFYQKAWDLNDYGSTRGTKSKMNLPGTLKANILDLIGNPAVQTSGYSRIDIDNLTSHHKPSTKQRVLQKHFEDYLKDKNLTREVLEDGTILYAHPEVTVVGYKD